MRGLILGIVITTLGVENAARAGPFVLGPVQRVAGYAGEPAYFRADSGVAVWWWQWGIPKYNIDVFDSTTMQYRRVRSTNDPQAVGHPDVHGRTVIWSENENGRSKIRSFHLDTGVYSDLTTNTPSKGLASIEGDVLAWQQPDVNQRADVYALVGGSSTPVPIANTPTADEAGPDISGRRIVYAKESTNPTRHEVEVYDVDAQAVVFHKAANGPVYTIPRPMISGDHVAWFQHNGSFEMHVANLNDGTEITISNIVERGALDDGVAVWYDRNQMTIFARDLSDGVVSPVRVLTTDSIPFLALDGRRLTWTEWEGDQQFGVYTALIPEPSIGLASLISLFMCALRRRGRPDIDAAEAA